MCKIVAAIVNFMQSVYVAWNLAWWDHHVQLARMHDERIKSFDPDWREKLEGEKR